MSELSVFTFSPDWGLPSTGPFALKLLAWLELAGIPYRQIIEDNPSKGPKGKNPWIELDGVAIGDTELIIDMLGKRRGVDLDRDLSAEERAIAHAWRRTFEDHFHMVLEWELFVHPAGGRYIESAVSKALPPVASSMVSKMMRRHFRRQLHARGIGRHAPEIIAAKGRADLDALEIRLTGRSFIAGDRPTLVDASVFGLVAPMLMWPMPTPVAEHAKTLPAVGDWCARMRERCFGTLALAA